MKSLFRILGIITITMIIGFSAIGCDFFLNGDNEIFTVTYEAGEGSGTVPSSEEVVSGEEINLPGQGDMTGPEGKVFSGWKTGDENYGAGAKYEVSKDVTFVAVWGKDEDEPGTITITGLDSKYNGRIAAVGLFKATGDIILQNVIADGQGLIIDGTANISIVAADGSFGQNFQPPMGVYIGFQILGDDDESTADDDHFFYVADENFLSGITWTSVQLSQFKGVSLEGTQVLQNALNAGGSSFLIKAMVVTKIIQELPSFSLSTEIVNEMAANKFLFIPNTLI
ncbi:MAG: InlB B-repeat-containing protein [Treponema sp.]|jgi:hypothetical protein|nr:InlB B-repeat-containing protein [Treponema sp.]